MKTPSLLRVQAEQIARHIAEASPIGAPSRLEDPDVVERLLAGLRDGLPRDAACQQAGLSRRTFYTWQRRAKEGYAPAGALVEAIEQAEAVAEAEHLENIRRAGQHVPQWTASAWYLERKYPERWGRRTREDLEPRVQVFIGGLGRADVIVNVPSSGSVSELPPGK